MNDPTPQSQAARVLAKFGGRQALIDTGEYTPAQVRYAVEQGHFHQREQQKLLDLAARHGVDLTPYDFIAHLVPGRRVTESAAG